MDRTRSRALIVVLLGLAVLSGCGSTSGGSQPSAPTGNGLQGLILKPAKLAPTLSLHDYTGQPISLGSLRGKAVLVTFVYTHCPDVCPLIVSNLAAADRGLGSEARHLQILAVTVDPRRDTPNAIKAFLAARRATGTMDYLIGSQAQMQRTWKAWDVGVSIDTKHVTTGHTSIVYGITASGRTAVVYNSDFTPAQIIHDVQLLARR